MTSTDLYEINKAVDDLLGTLSEERNHMPPQEVERKLKEIERERYTRDFFESMCCNFKTCRYNNDGKCRNEDKRKECIEVSRKVLRVEE